MALDRPEDEAGPDPPGRRARPDPPGGADGPADADGQAGSRAAGRTVEARSRTEYYEALRVADGKPADGKPVDGSSAASDRSGWDSVDAGERPPPDRVRVKVHTRLRSARQMSWFVMIFVRLQAARRASSATLTPALRHRRPSVSVPNVQRTSWTATGLAADTGTEPVSAAKPSFWLTGMTRRLSMRYRMSRGGPICRPGARSGMTVGWHGEHATTWGSWW
jgi:hypothetical protein